MPRISPRVDFAFKKLFGSEENKDILINFINSIVSEKDQVADLELRNPYNAKTFLEEKLSILDIKAMDKKGRWYLIEMQMLNQPQFAKRVLYYWSKVYSDQLKTGQSYTNLNKTISINILNFNYFDNDRYHNIFKIMNRETHSELLDDLEIHFIELEKYDENLSSLLDRWVNFLKLADYYSNDDTPEQLLEVQTIQKAFNVLDHMSMNDEERETYESSMKFLRDLRNVLEGARDEGKEFGIELGIELGMDMGFEQGMEKGIKEGLEKGALIKAIEIAKSLIGIIDNSIIADKTGLTITEIENLSKN